MCTRARKSCLSPLPNRSRHLNEMTALRLTRDDIGFFQAVKAALAKPRGTCKTTGEFDHAVGQLVAKAIVPEGEFIDVFSAAGLKQPDISILSEEFLTEVRGLKYKNVAAEL